MPIPTTKVYLDALLADGLAARITPTDGNSMTAELAIDLIGTTPLVQADFML